MTAQSPQKITEVSEETQDMRQKVLAMEDYLRDMEQVELEVIHHFSEGVYAREMRIPAGTIVTGKIHKHEHISIMSKGVLSIVTEDGPKVIRAPYTVISPPGTKRAVYALEDTIWTTIHATEERDLEKIEQHFIAKSFDELASLEQTKQLGE